MDSLTQIVLGASVGEAVLGKKVGNKAMLWGAVAGTIPDLDVLCRYVVDTVTAIEWHRGLSHSIFFSILAAPILGWVVWKLNKKEEASRKNWSLLMFWGLFTHPLLDAFTTWGTQLFWPFKTRLAFQSIFVIDPLYTLPFLVFLILAMFQKRTSSKRRRYNRLGLILSSSYLMLTLILKGVAHSKFLKSLDEQEIAYTDIDSRPTPFNSILWAANVDTPNAYLVGSYSFFDSQEVRFSPYRKNHELLGELKDEDKVRRLIAITEDWYTVSKQAGDIFLNDLRFGPLGFDTDAPKFAFTYQLLQGEKGVQVKEVPNSKEDAKKMLPMLWNRIWGN
ncbi:MAG: metal-dependent hydrolase [Bacteroidota bacterium]